MWSKLLEQAKSKRKYESAGHKEIDRLDPSKVAYCQMAHLASQRMKSGTGSILNDADENEEGASQDPSGEKWVALYVRL